MSADHTEDRVDLPATGEIDVVPEQDAAALVEDLARETGGTATPLLIALDIDGTILLEDQTLSPGVVEAVKDAHAAGHEIMLATGRSWETTEHILRKLGVVPEFVVCSNGAVTLRLQGAGRHADAEGRGVRIEDARYERFHVETFDASEVLTMLHEHLPDARYMVELENGTRRYTEYLDDWNLHRSERVDFAELSAQPVCRVVVVSPEQDEGDFLELVDRIGLNHVSYAIGWSAWLDIAPHGVDKGTALERVRDWLDVAPEDVIVIGDGRNDIGMFAWALEKGGRAVAMAQGPQEVLDAAGETTSSVDAGGVAEVLRAL